MTEPAFFDEMTLADGAVRPAYKELSDWLTSTPAEQFRLKRREADILFRRLGITFAVYGEGGDPERLIPFDVIPRVLSALEWAYMQKGLEQRVRTLNAFIWDIYHDQEILKAGVVPEALILKNSSYLPEMQGVDPPGGIYSHISGIDMVRVGENDFYVLEDNCRTPSGVSYMLENREVMMRLFPALFSQHRVAPVDEYGDYLVQTLRECAPRHVEGEATVAILTPGIFNSAYFEHSFLADQMGVELVEGQDLFVEGESVFMRTTQGPKQVDVIYRRIDDAFIDPLTFNPESALGVPGLMNVYRAGRITLANGVGAGIADDKAVYTYVPAMVKFYLGEEPILKNVPTYRCADQDSLAYVLDNLAELVVKEVHGSGGYGMLVGPKASQAEREAYAARIKADPSDFIAQPTLALSTCPTHVEEGVAPRHVDFRPFVLSSGASIRMVKGGLTRVALKSGSLVVNSSQGGGTKDTWVLEE
ncbi:MAG: circularly permuted type 2 ATP-grasp protein [Alphaproteobacteria bacterium]|nr:circularly permuted type 2 ATP-grasp protein [Alphaproteobacteria bacterium]